MTNRESYNREQLEKAGEQAAQVLGRFMSIATEFSNEFNRKNDPDRKWSGDTDSKKPASGNADVFREAGEELQKMREAAGYTLDSFAEALKREMNRPDIDESDVVVKVEAAESGQEPLPGDWLSQVATLLGSGDPLQFFERLQKGVERHSSASSSDQNNVQQSDVIQAKRVEKFSALFENDSELATCSDEQFEKLLSFVEKNYHEAKNLLISK